MQMRRAAFTLVIRDYNFIHPACSKSRAITFVIFINVHIFFTIREITFFIKSDSAVVVCM